jgi:hypothetical protein
LDDFQAAPGSAEKGGSNSAKYKWDHATEDRLCDLYEQYLEGMDEHKGPQTRKLYIELAEIWPEGWMDNIGIKAAVCRAKERKKRLTKMGKVGLLCTFSLSGIWFRCYISICVLISASVCFIKLSLGHKTKSCGDCLFKLGLE